MLFFQINSFLASMLNIKIYCIELSMLFCFVQYICSNRRNFVFMHVKICFPVHFTGFCEDRYIATMTVLECSIQEIIYSQLY